MNRFFAVFLLLGTLSGFAQTTAPASKPAAPAAEVLVYRPNTYDKLTAVYNAFTSKKLVEAEKLAKELLDYEPRCLEARWFLANIYKQKGELGNMMPMLAAVGIREVRESDYVRSVVYTGTKGYVLRGDSKSVLVDFNNADVKAGDSLIVYTEGAVLQHPITLDIIYVEKRVVAEAEVRQTSDSHSVAEVVKQYSEIAPGMRVILKSDFNEMLDTASDSTPAQTVPSTRK